MSSDFSLILHSIRHNYRTLTLSELAQQFNYSKPHLCTLIKQNTGVSFTELIKQIRMARAVEYLLHTELPIGEIAEIVGYHSTDHFSRVFRGAYSCSPQEYRRKTVKSADRFIPFEMK
jgi:AraC-like DNA-binding protein